MEINDLNESINELGKLVLLMDEDASSLNVAQALQDYLAPILGSMLEEIKANRNYVVQTADRANIAMMMNEKTLLGEILTSIAEHFVTILGELPEDIAEDSKLGVAVAEVQGLLSTWMTLADFEEDEDEEEDDSDMESDDSKTDDFADDEGDDDKDDKDLEDTEDARSEVVPREAVSVG